MTAPRRPGSARANGIRLWDINLPDAIDATTSASTRLRRCRPSPPMCRYAVARDGVGARGVDRFEAERTTSAGGQWQVPPLQIPSTAVFRNVAFVRLHQARLLMARDRHSVAAAAAAVGYVSTSQFSREFKRHFGRTASDEIRWMKARLGELTQAGDESSVESGAVIGIAPG
jgi:AraC-like DNA-binding protein